LYIADVLSEDGILKWYKETHSSRGWTVFNDQMKKFVEWLEQAEEEGKNILLTYSRQLMHLNEYISNLPDMMPNSRK